MYRLMYMLRDPMVYMGGHTAINALLPGAYCLPFPTSPVVMVVS